MFCISSAVSSLSTNKDSTSDHDSDKQEQLQSKNNLSLSSTSSLQRENERHTFHFRSKRKTSLCLRVSLWEERFARSIKDFFFSDSLTYHSFWETCLFIIVKIITISASRQLCRHERKVENGSQKSEREWECRVCRIVQTSSSSRTDHQSTRQSFYHPVNNILSLYEISLPRRWVFLCTLWNSVYSSRHLTIFSDKFQQNIFSSIVCRKAWSHILCHHFVTYFPRHPWPALCLIHSCYFFLPQDDSF